MVRIGVTNVKILDGDMIMEKMVTLPPERYNKIKEKVASAITEALRTEDAETLKLLRQHLPRTSDKLDFIIRLTAGLMVSGLEPPKIFARRK